VSAGTRVFWNRQKYIRPQELRSTSLSAPDFPETQQKPKTGTKNANLKIFFFNFFKIFIFFWILSIQKHEINKINAQLK
jgi:hypothetical protein